MALEDNDYEAMVLAAERKERERTAKRRKQIVILSLGLTLFTGSAYYGLIQTKGSFENANDYILTKAKAFCSRLAESCKGIYH